MTHRWDQATKKYEEKRLRPSVSPMAPFISKEDHQVELGASLLSEFMEKQGESAKKLLRAAGKHIIFGELREGGGYGVVYYIDGDGLNESYEAMGTWMAYSKEVPKPKITPSTAETAAFAAIHYGGIVPSELVMWLERKLDAIAAEADRQ